MSTTLGGQASKPGLLGLLWVDTLAEVLILLLKSTKVNTPRGRIPLQARGVFN